MLDFDRIKTSMIVFALEKELGNFILDNDTSIIQSEIIDSISERELSRNRSKVVDSRMLVKACYFGELFDFAIRVSEGKAQQDYFSELKEFCVLNDIFDIRNSVSHSTKDFHINYWYRAASIASHPSIEKLKLELVQEALYCAENDQLKSPPEEWLEKVTWSIPNNLPEEFEHSITSLIGRAKESEILKDKIKSPRADFISIIAPGGIGKTALILDVLKDVSLSPEFSNVADGICFVTLKKVGLTPDGLIHFDAINTISEIKSEIEQYFYDFHDVEPAVIFGDIIVEKEYTKLILCIDNLETLFIEEPDEFQEFISSLPRDWKVIVTSRVKVDDSANMPLQGLNDGLCQNLAREYLFKRGITHYHKEDISLIVKNAGKNPLAIRLCIDLMGKGYSVPESISQANSEIVKFSYDNLIDKLSENSVKVLESLLAGGALSRTDITTFLEFSTEELVESIKELTATTLIHKNRTDEVYRLSDSIRELLILNPRNLEIRSVLNEKVRRRNMELSQISREQEELNLDRYSAFYIPENISTELKLASRNINLICKSKNLSSDKTIATFKTLSDFSEKDKNSFFFQQLGRVTLLAGDFTRAINSFKKSISMDNSPVVKLLLAKAYSEQNSTEKALEVYAELVAEGYNEVENSALYFANDVVYGYFISLLYMGDFPTIYQNTKSLDGHVFREMLLLFRAAAFKRSVENKIKYDSPEVRESLKSSMELFSLIFKEFGYKSKSCVEFCKLTNELSTYAYANCIKNKTFSIEIAFFVEAHAKIVMSTMSDDANFCSKFRGYLAEIHRCQMDGNAFHNEYWHGFLDCFENSERANSSGYTVVKVNSIDSKDLRNFFIAADADGKTYLVHKRSVTNTLSRRWGEIDAGFPLCIKYRKDSLNPEKDYVYRTTHFFM